MVRSRIDTEDWDSDTFNSTPALTSVPVFGLAPSVKGDSDISCGTRDDANEDPNNVDDELYHEDDEEEDGEHAPFDHLERDAAWCAGVLPLNLLFFPRCP